MNTNLHCQLHIEVNLYSTGGHLLFFAVEEAVGGWEPTVGSRLPPAGERFFFRRPTVG